MTEEPKATAGNGRLPHHGAPKVRPEVATRGVVVVDDHPAIRDALATTIEREQGLHVCGATSSVDEACQLLELHHPAVLVLEVALPNARGLDLVQHFREDFPSVRLVVFSMYDENIYAERAIRAGASAYVMKSEPTRIVAEAIRCALRDEVYLSRSMSSRILNKLANGHQRQTAFAVDALTNRELSVFQMLGQGLSVDAIASSLDLSRKTIETYRRRAKEKLGLRSVGELLQYAVQWQAGNASVESARLS